MDKDGNAARNEWGRFDSLEQSCYDEFDTMPDPEELSMSKSGVLLQIVCMCACSCCGRRGPKAWVYRFQGVVWLCAGCMVVPIAFADMNQEYPFPPYVWQDDLGSTLESHGLFPLRGAYHQLHRRAPDLGNTDSGAFLPARAPTLRSLRPSVYGGGWLDHGCVVFDRSQAGS